MVKLISYNSVWNPELNAIHIAIPTEPQGGNHTPAFARAAISQAAHDATMVITKALALTGYRVLSDFDFFCKVKYSHPCRFSYANLHAMSGARFVRAIESCAYIIGAPNLDP